MEHHDETKDDHHLPRLFHQFHGAPAASRRKKLDPRVMHHPRGTLAATIAGTRKGQLPARTPERRAQTALRLEPENELPRVHSAPVVNQGVSAVQDDAERQQLSTPQPRSSALDLPMSPGRSHLSSASSREQVPSLSLWRLHTATPQSGSAHSRPGEREQPSRHSSSKPTLPTNQEVEEVDQGTPPPSTSGRSEIERAQAEEAEVGFRDPGIALCDSHHFLQRRRLNAIAKKKKQDAFLARMTGTCSEQCYSLYCLTCLAAGKKSLMEMLEEKAKKEKEASLTDGKRPITRQFRVSRYYFVTWRSRPETQ